MRFDIHDTTLIRAHAYDVEEITIPEGVTSIAAHALVGCRRSLRRIQLPSTLVSIQEMALRRCRALEAITLPPSLRSLGLMALAECDQLKEVTIPEGVEELDGTFFCCQGLERVHLPRSLKVISSAFIGCHHLQEIVLPPDARFTCQAFRGCYDLRRVEMHAASIICTRDSSPLHLPYCEELILHGKSPRLPSMRPGVLRSLRTPDMSISELPTTYRLHALLAYIRAEDDPTWTPAQRIGFLNYAAQHVEGLMKHAQEAAVCRYMMQHHLLKLPHVNALIAQLAEQDTELSAEVLAYRSLNFTREDMRRLEEQEEAAFERSLELALDPASTAYLRTQWSFTADGMLRHYKGVDSIITLPVCYRGKPVTATARRPMSEGVRSTYRNLRHVQVPSCYTELGENFLEGAQLETLTLPVTLEKVHPRAFDGAIIRELILYEPEGCTHWIPELLLPDRVEKLTVKEGVTRLPSIRFVGSPMIRRSISLPATLRELPHLPLSPRAATTWHISPGNPFFRQKKGCLLSHDGSVLYLAPDDVAALADLPGGVTEIAGGALEGCSQLTEAIVPGGVQHIGPMAFARCNQLQKAVLPRSVKTVGDRIFAFCKAMTAFHAEEGLDSIGEYAFTFCDQLAEVHLPWTVCTIGRYAFSRCRQLRQLQLPLCLREIPEGLLHGSYGVDHLTVPLGTRCIHPAAFRNSMLCALHVPRDHSLEPGTLQRLATRTCCITV